MILLWQVKRYLKEGRTMTKKIRFLHTVITLSLVIIAMSGCAKDQKNHLKVLTTDETENKMVKDIFQPFARHTQISVEGDYESDSSLYDKMNKIPNNVDIIEYSEKNAVMANDRKLIKKIDFSRLKNFKYLSSDKQKIAKKTNSIPYAMSDLVIVYNPITVKKVDYTFELWNPEQVGQLSLPDISTPLGPDMIQLGNEYSRYKSTSCYVGYDIGNDGRSALEALQKLQPFTKTYQTTADLIKSFKKDNTDTAMISSSQVKQIHKALPDLKFSMPEDVNTVHYQMAAILKGTKNTEAAYKYLDYRISQDVQRKASQSMQKMPVNAVVQKTDKSYLNYGSKNVITMNYQYMNEHLPKWTDEWKSIFG